MKIIFRFLLIGFVLMLIVVPTVPFYVEAATHKPFGTYHANPLSKILYPRLGAPVILTSGSSFEVYLRSDLKEGVAWGAVLQSFFNRYDFTVQKAELDAALSDWKLTISVPVSVVKGLYNLTVYPSTSSLLEYSEPNSVYIVGPEYPSTLRLAVISDTHYGIVSPYYDLTTRILRRTIDALNAIGVDLVIGTGDMTDATIDEQVFTAMRSELLRLQVPILLAPGNNDHQSVLRGKYLWEEYLAPNSADLEFGRYRFVMLDSQEGSIPEEQLEWARETLGSAPGGSFKVMLFHIPYWTEAHSSLKVEIPKIITDYGVGLTLHGHWHVDAIQPTPTLGIVTTSLSTSEQFVGYRLLSLTSDGIQYTSQSLPYDRLNVTYLQRNDFTSTGGAVLIENGLETPLDFTTTLLLRNSATLPTEPFVDGGTVVRSTSKKAPNAREVVQVLTALSPGQRQLVKVYYEKDTTPPTVSIGTRISDSIISVIPVASDFGLGVLSLRLFYSEDNGTWTEAYPEVVERIEVWSIGSSARRVYLRVEVVDAAGLKTVRYAVLEPTLPTTTTTQVTPPPAPVTPLIYLGLIAVVVAALILMLASRRKRRTRER